eukprot:s1259_g21.t1
MSVQVVGRFVLYGNICLDCVLEVPSYPKEDSSQSVVQTSGAMSLWILLLAFPIAVANTGSSWRYGDSAADLDAVEAPLSLSHMCRKGVIISPETVGDRSTEPGIASFAQHPSRAGESLKPLVDYMMQTLKHDALLAKSIETANWAQTPIYLRATAGMRLLFPDQREAILDDIRSFFRTLPFMFRNDMASVATGEEEGVFGWISANYLLGNLEPDRTPATNTTVGSLDLGGASAQIVFMPQKSIIQHEFPLKLGPHRLQLYSFSFLHFGIREAAHSTASRVISDALLAVQSETEVYHPCFAKGYIYTPKFSYSAARFPAIRVKMQGTSDFMQCQQLIMRIFNKDAPCLVAQCSFYGVYQPRLYQEKFLAFAHFALIARDLGLPETAQLEDFRAATQYVCSLTIDILNSLFARVEDVATGFTKTLGGNGANSCRVLAQLVPSGQSVSSLGIVPAQGDADGEFALKILQAGGVETSLLQRGSAADDAGLPTSFVLLSADSGARTIISSRRGLKEMDASHLKEVLKQVEDGAPLCWCHLECRQMPGVLQMASILRPEVPDFRSPLKPILSVEVEKPALEVGALLPLLQRCDVAFFSSDFIRAQASNLLDTNDVQATAVPSGEVYFEKALAVKVVDSLGAGDTFVAASLCALGGGADPQQVLRFACGVAGKKVSQAGLAVLHRLGHVWLELLAMCLFPQHGATDRRVLWEIAVATRMLKRSLQEDGGGCQPMHPNLQAAGSTDVGQCDCVQSISHRRGSTRPGKLQACCRLPDMTMHIPAPSSRWSLSSRQDGSTLWLLSSKSCSWSTTAPSA